MAQFTHHLFVCENQRAADHPRGSCGSDGSAVRAALKAEIKRRQWKGKVRANCAGCLDQCSHGVVIAVYPQSTWYGGVSVADVPELLDALQEGKVVTRLQLDDRQLTGRSGPLGESEPDHE